MSGYLQNKKGLLEFADYSGRPTFPDLLGPVCVYLLIDSLAMFDLKILPMMGDVKWIFSLYYFFVLGYR